MDESRDLDGGVVEPQVSQAGPKADLAVALTLAALGLGSAIRGLYLGIPLTDLNGPGLAPFAFGMVLAGTGAAAAVRSWLKVRRDGAVEPAKAAVAHLRGPALGLFLLIAYVVALEPLGFLLATFVFGLVTLRFLGWRGWKGVASAVLLAGGVYAVFSVLLGAPLPTGLFG